MYRKTILDNGLTVILKELHHAPAACLMMWYRVGSRNERPGITGISHWVEHQMFSGTAKYAKGEIDRLISRKGGYWNAFTWLDNTAYYATVPTDQIGLCLRLEADRMVNTIFSEEAVETERSIILSERAMYEDDPRFLLSEKLTSTAFRVHPYKHEVIGDEVDIKTITWENLQNYYRHHYVPNNAVLIVTGDFDSAEILSDVVELFGDIPASESVVRTIQQEPAQHKERRVIVNGPGDTAYLTMAYHAPEATNPDYAALTLLNAAFAGGSSLGAFAGGGSNRSSRLYKTLVDAEYAVSAGGDLAPTVDPFLYAINVVVRNGRNLEEVEAVLNDELEKLAVTPTNRRELDKALRRARAQFIMAGESITGQAHLLGMAEAVAGDCHWYESTIEKLNKVTLEDLERVRQSYLSRNNRTVGWYQPDKIREQTRS